MDEDKLKEDGSKQESDNELSEILEEAEILSELREEEKIRKKNAKIITMAVAGVLICGAVFYWSHNKKPETEDPTQAPPPSHEEMFPQAGEVKIPGKPAKVMKSLDDPLVSDEDVIFSEEEEKLAKVTIPPPETLPVAKKKVEQKVPRKAGYQPVRIEEKTAGTTKEKTEGAKKYKIFVGAFVLDDELKNAKARVKSLGLSSTMKKEKKPIKMHKVAVGPYPSRSEVADIQKELKDKRIDGFVINKEGRHYVSVGSFYKEYGASEMKRKVERLGYPSRTFYQASPLLCRTLYVTKKGALNEAEKVRSALRNKGFKAAEILRR